MKSPAPPPARDQPPYQSVRVEEARRIIEEYAAELRAIIDKLRRKLN
ncbi:hypothetical protein [Bradyrhizobium diazoefficiens]